MLAHKNYYAYAGYLEDPLPSIHCLYDSTVEAWQQPEWLSIQFVCIVESPITSYKKVLEHVAAAHRGKHPFECLQCRRTCEMHIKGYIQDRDHNMFVRSVDFSLSNLDIFSVIKQARTRGGGGGGGFRQTWPPRNNPETIYSTDHRWLDKRVRVARRWLAQPGHSRPGAKGAFNTQARVLARSRTTIHMH
jgi:hypothetical protein